MNKVKNLLKIAVPLLAFGFLWSELYKLTSSIDKNTLLLNPNLLAASLVLLLVLFIADAAGWNLILRSLKQHLSLERSLYIWFYSSFCRYIPGMIWPYLTRIELCKSAGIDRPTATTSMLLENLLLAGTSLALGAPLFFYFYEPNALEVLKTTPLILLGFVLLIYVSRSTVALQYTDKYLSTLKSLTPKALILLILYYLAFWLIFGITFLLFCQSIVSISEEQLLLIVLVFPVSFAIGFIASISPGGLGIREGVLYTLLMLQMDSTNAAFIAITSRLWLLAVELLIAFAITTIFLIKRFSNQKK